MVTGHPFFPDSNWGFSHLPTGGITTRLFSCFLTDRENPPPVTCHLTVCLVQFLPGVWIAGYCFSPLWQLVIFPSVDILPEENSHSLSCCLLMDG